MSTTPAHNQLHPNLAHTPTTPPDPTTPPPPAKAQQITARCSATTHTGHPCRFTPRHTTGLCVNHDPTYTAEQARNRAQGTRAATTARGRLKQAREHTAAYSLDPWALADRASIQALLDAVVRLELAGRLPNSRVRNLLRALSIATRNFDTPPRDPADARTYRHNLNRYNRARTLVDTNLETLLAEAEHNDAARRE